MTTSTLSFPVAPMKATMGGLPNGGVDDDAWAYEVKWDGHRTLAHVDGDAVRFQTTGGHDSTARWPDVAGLPAAVNASRAILDGEMLVIGDDGRPSFDLVQQHGARTHPAVFHVFDVVSIDGTDTIDLPYADRRALLAQLVEDGDHWRVPAHRVGDGAALFAATGEQGLEGVIAKRIDSRYRPGTRSKDWIKVKHRRRVTLPVGGFTAGTGARSSTFGSLLVGRPEPSSDDAAGGTELRFAGGVGTGFTHARLGELLERLRPLVADACPFDPPPPRAVARTATWVEPVLAATIEIAEFTNEGLVRHATFVDLHELPDDHRDGDGTLP